MQKPYLECGKVVSTHGIRGEVKILPWCDDAAYLLHFSTLYFNRGEAKLEVECARVHKGMLVAKFAGINTMDDGAKLRGRVVYLAREDAPAEEAGVFFIQDLLGLAAVDADNGQSYGTLTDVFPTGANDVYELTGEDGVKRLVPAIRDVVVDTDIAAGIMRIRPLRGLFDDAH